MSDDKATIKHEVFRSGEMAALRKHLDDPDCHLLTLFGPGGIGKTRLALEAARALLADDSARERPHGVYLVSLTGVGSSAGIASAIGDAELLGRYADWRRSDQKKLVGFTDGIVRLFGSGRGTTRLARNLGMLAFDLVPGVRGEFARHTMGLAGRLPRLSRGVALK